MRKILFIFLIVNCILVIDNCFSQWVARYHHYSSGTDLANSIAVDGSGNVYVTGGSRNDYATIKYNSSGVQQWVARYNGPGNNHDETNSITVDASGNVYVTGSSFGSGTNVDYATIKYNSSGVEQWVQRYNGPGNVYDEANSIALDALGNVYVTGVSTQGVTRYDYITIKYNSSGVQQWIQAYNSPGNGADGATCIALDGSGNVYVTGGSLLIPGNSDYATIKYSSSGVEQWVQRYNGPGNGYDEAHSIAVDALGNVFVTGESAGSGSSSDYATIKYNSAGAEQWIQRYNGPGNTGDDAYSLTVDGSSNVYVVGRSLGSGTNYDFAAIKYSNSGVQQWVQRYNGTGNLRDYAYSIAVDGSGNVYLTGQSEGSGTSWDYATIKYNSAGAQQWLQRFDSPGGSADYARSIALDSTGNVYVTGYSGSGAGNYDFVTLKYNTTGVQQWLARYNSPGNGFDYALSMVLDGSGNVCVTGFSRSSKGSSTWYSTVKHNNSGANQWTAQYFGPAGQDTAYSIATDRYDNVYITGSSLGSGTGTDYATIKYSSSGSQQWVQRYNGPGNGSDAARSICVDDSGNVYVSGWSWDGGTNYDYATIKYNTSGALLWVQRYNGPGNGSDAAYSVRLDVLGNVYVTGGSVGSGSSNDYATIKYNPSGVQQWIQRYDGPGSGNDLAYSIVTDRLGNAYIAGQSMGSGTGSDYATIKYNSSGVQQWVQRYNGSGNSEDFATSIAIDSSGNVSITGSSTGIGTGSDYATIKYSSSGVEQWVQTYNGPGNSSDLPTSIAVDNSDAVFVTGGSIGLLTNFDYATIKYSQPIGINPVSNEIPKHFSLSQNYPNPFNPATNIEFSIPKSGFVNLTIYDAMGREIETLVNQNLTPGTYKADWGAAKYSSGIYFYKLSTGDYTETKKMILIK